MHEQQISHGDLKPENIVYETKATSGPKSFTRLIDFGFAVDQSDQLFKSHGKATSLFGTPLYLAPEKIYNEALTELSDIWAVGVITYYMLAGYPPFFADSEEKLFKKIKTCDFDFDEGLKTSVSSECLDFMNNMLEPVVKRRMTAKQALQHPWIKMHNKLPHLNEQIIRCLLNVKELNEF